MRLVGDKNDSYKGIGLFAIPTKKMKKNQHYIPQFYLRYWFSKPHKKIWTYYKDPSKNPHPYKGNPILISPKSILFEEFLYSIGENQGIEDWLAVGPENLIGEAFSKISKNLYLSEDDEPYIKAFPSLILARHPRMKSSCKHIAEAFGLHTENPLAQTLKTRFKHSFANKSKFHLQLQHISQELRSSWSFITSDTPVVTNVVTNVNQTKGYRFYFYPLSPYTIALLLPLKPEQKEIIIQATEIILKINRILAEFSDDILIANSSYIIEKNHKLNKFD